MQPWKIFGISKMRIQFLGNGFVVETNMYMKYLIFQTLLIAKNTNMIIFEHLLQIFREIKLENICFVNKTKSISLYGMFKIMK